MNTNPPRILVSFAVLAFVGSPTLAQHEPHQPRNHEPHAPGQPPHHDPAAAPKADERVGDPYPLDTCPISGKKLGTMGDPLVKLYHGREIRFCCAGCPERFEKDFAASIAKVDEKLAKAQRPLYPLRTSVVTGQELPAKPYELVYGNRLILLGAESEKAEFVKQPKKYLAALDKAVADQQGKDYPLKTCVVSNEKFGGDMGEPVDVVFAGRLIRLCCEHCKKDLEQDPAKFIAEVDAARKGDKAKPGGG